MKTVNLKEGMPLVHQALTRLERELAAARARGSDFIRLIHGYGSVNLGTVWNTIQNDLPILKHQMAALLPD